MWEMSVIMDGNTDKLLVAASFGTSHEHTFKKNIKAVEERIEAEFPGWKTARVYTSGIIRKVLAGRGIDVDDLSSCLEKAKAGGIKQAAVLPTHLLYGVEYEKLVSLGDEFKDSFDSLEFGKPLLADTRDLLELTEIIADEFPKKEGRCIILMGHGTEHYVNPVYASLEYMFRQLGRSDILVGTVEAYPELEHVLSLVKAGGYKAAAVTPLMLVAGDHAAKDMAGDDKDSWKSQLEALGLDVTVVMRGLGEIPAVQDMYVRHCRELIG